MERFLITTADERTWKFDRPVLFLGEWCRRYDRQHVWSQMDVEMAAPYLFSPEEKESKYRHIRLLTHQLEEELAEALNVYHETGHTLRYWQILLSQWLKRFVEMAFNRYHNIEQVLNKHDISGTTIFDSSGYSLATADSLTFVHACNDDIWNHVFYVKALEFHGVTKTCVDAKSLHGINNFSVANSEKLHRGRTLKQLIRKVYGEVSSRLARDEDAFIIESFLPHKAIIELQLSMGQFPNIWQRPKFQAAGHDTEQRKKFHLNFGSHVGFEKFIRMCLPEVIPTCYLEGYVCLNDQADRLPWPAKPKFIFTSNNYDMDEVFKAWAAKKVERQGTPYFIGQHGTNYTSRVGADYWPEFFTADKFLSWGWTNHNSKIIPAFIFKTVGARMRSKRYKADSLLLVENMLPHRMQPEDLYPEFMAYQEGQYRFVEALPEELREKLIIRLHGGWKESKWFEPQRWKNRNPRLKIELGIVPIKQLVAQSRLVVHSYESTGVLESLALNIPTVCFWHGGLNDYLPSSKPYYELLREAGIIVDSPEQAAELVSLHWKNIRGWWENKKIQDARKVFCNQYARGERHPIRKMKHLLTDSYRGV